LKGKKDRDEIGETLRKLKMKKGIQKWRTGNIEKPKKESNRKISRKE